MLVKGAPRYKSCPHVRQRCADIRDIDKIERENGVKCDELSYDCLSHSHAKTLKYIIYVLIYCCVVISWIVSCLYACFVLSPRDKLVVTLGCLSIKMLSYQHGNPHVKDKTVSRQSLTWESPYLGKTVFILRRGPWSRDISIANDQYFWMLHPRWLFNVNSLGPLY